MKTDRNALDYLIVSTGYTSRLIKLLGFDNVELIKKDASNSKYKKKYQKNTYKVGFTFDYKTQKGIDKILKDVNDWRGDLISAFHFDDRPDGILPSEYIDEFAKFIDSCVYIYDDLWGHGLYKISDNDDEINKIISILDAKKIRRTGTICFKCKSRKDISTFTNIIKKLNYCCIFDYEGDEYVDTDELIISIASFDSESG